MGQIRKLILAVALFGGGLWIGSMMIANADFGGDQPGTATDPLVTKSYVDEKIAGAVAAEIEKLKESGDWGGGGSGDVSMEVVKLRQGFKIVGEVGTEFIVRNGKTVVFSNSVNGIPDVTAGKDIQNGELVENNHHLINAGEGRGIKPHEDTTGTIFVLVRGEFTLLQEPEQ